MRTIFEDIFLTDIFQPLVKGHNKVSFSNYIIHYTKPILNIELLYLYEIMLKKVQKTIANLALILKLIFVKLLSTLKM